MRDDVIWLAPGEPIASYAKLFRPRRNEADEVKDFRKRAWQALAAGDTASLMAMFADYTKTLKKSDLDAMIPEAIEARAFIEGEAKAVLSRFATRGLAQGKTPGDPIKIFRTTRRTDTAISEGTALAGNEMKPTFTTVTLTLASYAQAFSIGRAAQFSKVNIVRTCSDLLQDWLTYHQEKKLYDTLQADSTIKDHYTDGGCTVMPNDHDYSSLTSTDTLDVDTLRLARALLEHRQAPAFRPRTAAQVAERKSQVLQGGWDGYYIGVFPPEMLYDLRGDTDYKDAVEQASEPTLGLARFDVVEGIVLVSGDPEIFDISKGGGYSFNHGYGYIFGVDAIAMVIARTDEGEIIQIDKTDDFGRIRELGVEYWAAFGVINPKRVIRVMAATSKDFG